MTLKPTKISQLVLSIVFFAGLLAWFAATPTPVFAAEIETLGCSETPVEGDLCIHVVDSGGFSTERYTSGSWYPVTESSGSTLLASVVGYNLGYPSGGYTVKVSNTRTGDTVTTVLLAGELVYTQTITYSSDDEWVNYHWNIANPGIDVFRLRFIHANDNSYSDDHYSEPTWVGNDTIGTKYSTPDALWVYELQGLLTPDAYQSSASNDITTYVNNSALTSSLEYAYHNGYALQWNRATLANGETWEISARERFSLEAPMPLLVVEKDPSDIHGGVITSSPAGIACGLTSGDEEHCIARFDAGAAVALTFTSAPGYTFLNWNDHETGSTITDNPLTVQMNEDRNISAFYDPLPVDVGFTVTDGSGHAGMPLNSTITAISQEYGKVSGNTDPFTGQTSLQLNQGVGYTLWIASPGYLTQHIEVQYLSTSVSEAIAMLPDPAVGCPVGYHQTEDLNSVTTFAEGFEGGVFPPEGWQEILYDGINPEWQIAADSHTGGASMYLDGAIDADNYMSDELVSIPIHIPANGQLSFYQKVNTSTYAASHEIFLINRMKNELLYLGEVETPDQEDTWQQVSYDLSIYAGQDLLLQFRYFSYSMGDRWFIDDIRVEGVQGTCETLNGGRIAGYVTDVETSEAIYYATVAAGGNSFYSRGDGYFAAWAPAGEAQVEAYEDYYFATSETVSVIADSTVRQDIALERGYKISANPSGRGSGAITRDKEPLYRIGDSVHLTATPDAYSTFAGWRGDGITAAHVMDNPLELSIPVNFWLSARFNPNPAALTVTLTDGGAHAGMPLAGVVTLRAENTYGEITETDYPTDPFTGQAVLSIEQNIEYTIFASADGYGTQARVVKYLTASPGEPFALLPEAATGCPVGYTLLRDSDPSLLLDEGFEGGSVPPDGWTMEIDAWGAETTWTASADAHSGSFSAFHDVEEGSQRAASDQLVSPLVHIPAGARLTFSQKVGRREEFMYHGSHNLNLRDSSVPNDTHSLDIVLPPETTNTWGETSYDLSAYAGQDVYIVFRHYGYTAYDGYYLIAQDDQWWLDDIRLEGTLGTCEALSGGQVAGYVTDWAASTPLSGAAVAAGDETTISAGDGLYRLWLPAGAAQLTASASNFHERTASIAVAASAITRQDFALAADSLTVHALAASPSGSGAGTISADSGGPYPQGDIVHLTAHPAAGSRFTGWSGAGVDPARTMDNPLALTITAGTAITAGFDLAEYSLTVTISGSGSVTRSPDKATYLQGDVVTLSATPSAGAHFVAWSGGGLSGDTPTAQITISGDTLVYAVFAETQYSLDVLVVDGAGGAVTRDKPGPYHLNDVVRLTAAPATNYHFSAWGGDASGGSETVDVTITGNMLVTARFDPNQADLGVDLSAAPAGAGKTGLRITLTNHGPDPASGAALTATFGSGLGEITWTCAGAGAACPNASGGGSLNETFPVLPSGATLTYTITASTPGPDGLDVNAAITAPPGLIDPHSANNTAALLLNKTLYKVAVPLIIKR